MPKCPDRKAASTSWQFAYLDSCGHRRRTSFSKKVYIHSSARKQSHMLSQRVRQVTLDVHHPLFTHLPITTTTVHVVCVCALLSKYVHLKCVRAHTLNV